MAFFKELLIGVDFTMCRPCLIWRNMPSHTKVLMALIWYATNMVLLPIARITKST